MSPSDKDVSVESLSDTQVTVKAYGPLVYYNMGVGVVT